MANFCGLWRQAIFDFNDHMFVFTGVTTAQSNPVPDGGMTFAVLGMALGGLGLLRRKL